MFVGKLFEMILQDGFGHDDDWLFQVFSINLKKKTFLQISGSYPRRIKFLNNHQNLMKFFISGFQSNRKGQIVGYGFQLPSQVTIIINISQDIFSKNFPLSFG